MDCENRCDFSANYERSGLPAIKELEREVLGCNYGGTSYTTAAQVPNIIDALALDPDTHLLEVGSGSGWPGLYLSNKTNCRVTLLDLPVTALMQAVKRAETDNMSDRVSVVNGDGTAMPFASASFDRVSHSDVLCCLPQKLEFLRECRRVVQDKGRMHFSVIKPAPDLPADDHQRAVETGPPFVDVAGGRYEPILEEAGWHVAERDEVSGEYADTLEALATGLRRNTQELQDIFGADELREAWQHREDQLALVNAGHLQRLAYVVVAA